MSGTPFVDHRADLSGHRRSYVNPQQRATSWSARKKLSCLLVCSLASWMLVVSPFFIWG